MKITKQTAEHYNWGNTCDGWHSKGKRVKS